MSVSRAALPERGTHRVSILRSLSTTATSKGKSDMVALRIPPRLFGSCDFCGGAKGTEGRRLMTVEPLAPRGIPFLAQQRRVEPRGRPGGDERSD